MGNLVYIITQPSKKANTPDLMLADRAITKTKWWTNLKEEALQLVDKPAAEVIKKKLKFNNVQVIGVII